MHSHATHDSHPNTLCKEGILASLLIGIILTNFLLHILPEAVSAFSLPYSPVWIFFGISLQWLLHQPLKVAKSAATQFLIFLIIHNISDGLIVGFASILGLLSAASALLSVLGHDIVHKIIGYSLLRKEGNSIRTSFIKIAIPTISLATGFFLGRLLGISEESPALTSFTAGSLLYVTLVISSELKDLKKVFGSKNIFTGLVFGAIISYSLIQILENIH
jgi:zinc transporter ZupT